MIYLDKALRAWGTPSFNAILRREIARLGIELLPLHQGLSTGNYVADTPITVALNSVVETNDVIRIRAGIFFQSVIGGCSCADDPTHASEINEYCEVQFDIDSVTAITVVTLVTE